MISKSLSTSQKFASLATIAGDLHEFSQLLFPLIVAHSDDFGRLQGDPFTVKHQCHPTSTRSLEEFELALRHLHEVGLIIWFATNGRQYIQINDFEKHQQGLHKRTRSNFPRAHEDAETPDFIGSDTFRELPGQLKGRELNLTKENLSTTSAVPALMKHYHDGYLKRFSEKPQINGAKDGAILKRLEKAHGQDAVIARIDRMLDSTDPFIASSGRTIGVLQACWNKLAGPLRAGQRPGRVPGCKHEPPCVDAAAHTKRDVEDRKKGAA